MRVGGGRKKLLLSICEAELEEVSGHEHEQHQPSDGQIQSTAHQSRTNKDVEQGAQQHVLLDDVCLETESCPVQAHVEGSLKHVKTSDGVNGEKIKNTALRVRTVRSF